MLPGATDRLFLVFCRTGDARALGRVFDRTAPELLRVALYLCGDHADADDLVQRTFLAAIEGRATYDPRRRAVPWLLGILANHGKQLQRERLRRRTLAPEVPPTGEDPPTAASRRELTERIARLRAELGAPYAEVLELHLEHGLNAREIASKLGRPPGTVRTQLVRALDRMRKHLPAGFVAGFLPAQPNVTSLAAIKTSVLSAANHAALTAGAAAVAATLTTGGLLVSKKLLLAAPASLLLLAGGLFTVWSGNEDKGPPPRSTEAARADALQRSAAPAAADANTTDAAAERRPAAPATDDDPGFGALRVVVRWPDGKPAPGIGVGAAGLEAARNERRIAVTGADGSCLLPHLRPAPWRVSITHAEKGTTLVVAAGAPQFCELQAEVGDTVRGRVVDDRELPVADAEVWIATANAPERQFGVVRTGSDGRFALPVAVPVHLCARKAGFASPHAQVVDPHSPPAGDLVLALRGRGGRIEGTVRDARGLPIAWARVLVGQSRPSPALLNSPYEPQRFKAAGPETCTDRDGRFVVHGVEPGREIVQAWAPGHALAVRALEVAGEVTMCDLVLAAGAVVQGQVRDAAGRPVRDASVHRTFDQGGFVASDASTDAEGRYRLDDLAAGLIQLEASAPASRATASFELTAGATTEWSPRLARISEIRGRVLDQNDRGVAAMEVHLCDRSGMPAGGASATTDADGTFALVPTEDGPVDLRVGAWAAPPLKTVTNVPPGAQDLVIHLTAADLPSARIRGRIVDENGGALVATATANRAGEGFANSAEAGTDGRFEIGPLPAGRYRGRIATATHGSLPLPAMDLRPDAIHDVGDVVARQPGSAVIEVRDEAGKPTRGFVMVYTHDGDWGASMQSEQGRATFAALQPGRYFVCCGGSPLAAHADLEVLPAARAHAVLQLARVGHADVTVGDPAGAAELDLTVVAFAGERFAGMFGNQRYGSRVRLWLLPGRYTVEVRAGDGRRVRSELAIAGLDDHPAITVELPSK